MSEGKAYVEASVMDKLPPLVKAELAKLPPEKQSAFVDEFKRKSKSLAMGYLLWFVGFHYIYLGKAGTQIFYWLTCGGVFVWIVVDAVRMPGMINEYNRDKATEIMRDFKILGT